MESMFSAAEVAAISGGRRPPAPKNYRLPEVFPSLSKAKRISLDLESLDESIGEKKGPGWRRDAYIVGFGLGIGDRKGNIEFSEYFPLRHKGVQNLDASRVYDWLCTELAFFRGEIVGANLLYDFDGFQYQDVQAPLAKFRDIQWSEALLDENAFSYQLNTLGKKYGFGGKVNEELKRLYGDDYIKRFHEVHPGHARTYGVGDIELPLLVLCEQEKELRHQNLDELFDIESRLLPFLLYMRRYGIRVDLNKAARMNIELAETRDKTIREIATMSGVDTDYDNFGKPQIMKAIFDRLDIKYPYLLPKKEDGKDGEIVNPPDEKSSPEHIQRYEHAKVNGKPSFRKLWLDQVLDHPISDLILKANGAEKARGTFVDGYITDNAIGDRVYCEFHPLRRKKDENTKSQGTITGRFSSSNPNLQNIPARDDIIGPMCRSMFLPDEGCDFFSADYSQIEYRFLVHYGVEYKCTGADVPQRMYQTNPLTDFHDACAMMMYKKEWDEATAAFLAGRISEKEMVTIHKRLRKPAKNLNFGMVYGMGAPLLAAQLGETNSDGSPNDKANGIMKDYHAAAPYIRELNKICVSEAEKQEFITTILNRRGRFHLWEPRYKEKGKEYGKPCSHEEALAQWGNKIHLCGTHKSMNKRLQGSAADMLKMAMILIWESGVLSEGVHVGLTVHDELDGSVERTDRARAALKEMVHIMETAIPLHIPVAVSCSTGLDWSETH